MEGGLIRVAKRLFGESISEGEPLSRHCSFRIGGLARLFLRANRVSTLEKALSFCEENGIVFTVLGRGTNVLISDSGFGGMVICIKADGVQFDGNRIVAEAGAWLSKVARAASNEGFAGMEFCAGIPGSVGGAAVMNAGAHDGCMGDLIDEVLALDAAGREVRFQKEDLGFGYRQSSLREFPGIVTRVRLVLQEDDPAAIRERMEGLLETRRRSQPVGARCAGSVFKNPAGDSAGRLIDLAGCKGAHRGGAAVSRKHANFIVNRGGASYSDVKGLIEHVRERVRRVCGVELELEIIDLGEKA